MEWVSVCSYEPKSNSKEVKTSALSIKPETKKDEAGKGQKRLSWEDYDDKKPQNKSAKTFISCACTLKIYIFFFSIFCLHDK